MKDHFNSRPHEEIDPASNVTAGTYLAFQLTISRGGRPDSRAFYTVAICISTHDLARRSTVRWEKQPDGENISTHDLTRRSTLRPFFHALPATFQLTTSRGGRPFLTSSSLYFFSFQLTTSRGGRRYMNGLDGIPSVFQLTTSRGGRRVHRLLQSTREEFQLTTSRGGRHQPSCWLPDLLCISTHDLTRRSTKGDNVLFPTGLFQLTTSRGGRQVQEISRPV